MATLKNELIGTAGVHFVSFKLALRGLIVLPTIRNTAGVDLLVFDPANGSQASLQVKTSQRKVAFWPTSSHGKLTAGPHTFYVFLRYVVSQQLFQAYLEPSIDVIANVKSNAEDQISRRLKDFPCWKLPATEAGRKALENAWDTWKP